MIKSYSADNFNKRSKNQVFRTDGLMQQTIQNSNSEHSFTCSVFRSLLIKVSFDRPFKIYIPVQVLKVYSSNLICALLTLLLFNIQYSILFNKHMPLIQLSVLLLFGACIILAAAVCLLFGHHCRMSRRLAVPIPIPDCAYNSNSHNSHPHWILQIR